MKIFLIVAVVFVLLLAAVGVYGYYTYKQIKSTVAVLQSENETFMKDLSEVAKGNCTKLPNVTATIKDMGEKVKGLCGNLFVRFAIARGWTPKALDMKTLCAEINKPNNPIEGAIYTLNAACANRTVMQNATASKNTTAIQNITIKT